MRGIFENGPIGFELKEHVISITWVYITLIKGDKKDAQEIQDKKDQKGPGKIIYFRA